jgi:hypothetical protein
MDLGVNARVIVVPTVVPQERVRDELRRRF